MGPLGAIGAPPSLPPQSTLYLRLDQVSAGNMTGNVVILGMAVIGMGGTGLRALMASPLALATGVHAATARHLR
ncbi:hypothetical protein ACFY4C_32875 [Actinomadura viridis]|uniref:hypothetical protein n=1 Tax=Actinomadura viridis TaxID=58110 RepID=UPI0036813C2E